MLQLRSCGPPSLAQDPPPASADAGRRAGGVEVKVNEAAKRVDVTIDGKPFTSYIWPSTLKKPVLYPLRTAKGTLVTRGFPLDPRPGERVDHPHHVGMWLNHGDVNGLDFWNNSDAIPAAQAPKMGTIYHRKIVDAKSGADAGRADRRDGVDDARQQAVAQGDDAVRVPRRRRRRAPSIASRR